jgi:hypothetical protein
MKKSLAIFFAAMVAVVMPVSANAATVIEGDTIRCSASSFPNSRCNGTATSTVPVVFGGDPEFSIFVVPDFDPLLTFDFKDGILTLASLGNRTINGTIFTFTLTNGRIFTGVTGGGALASRASIVNGGLVLNLSGGANAFNFTSGQTFDFNVSAIPEPGTWMLMILGLGAVGFAMRRRQASTARYQFA